MISSRFKLGQGALFRQLIPNTNQCRCLTADIQSLPRQFLWDADPSNYDRETLQRNNVSFNPENGKPGLNHHQEVPSIRNCRVNAGDDSYELTWECGKTSKFSRPFIDTQLAIWKQQAIGDNAKMMPIILWNGLTEDEIRASDELSFDFEDVLTLQGQERALRALYQYGILLVTQTPIDDASCTSAIAAMAASMGGGTKKDSTSVLTNFFSGDYTDQIENATDGPLRTLYGGVWSTSSSQQPVGTSVADSAYGNEALPLHTDMTYIQSPPGLQIFTMVQPARYGGESIYGDGFAAAEVLRSEDPRAFGILSKVDRRYRCVDQQAGWHLEALGPVIQTFGDTVKSIRHNDLDRLPDLPPSDVTDVDAFYRDLREAHQAWDQVLSRDDIRLTMKLRAGDTIVVANQRCFHGRRGFTLDATSSRIIKGCYVAQDELDSRFRCAGFPV